MDIPALKRRFHQLFPANTAPAFAARAPGRVNLIGEHTDYNGGFVCPMAIDRETVVLAAPRNDTTINMHSVLANTTVQFTVDREIPIDGPEWALYARGSVEAMRRKNKVSRGFDCVVDSTVPLGGGLSSSAAFEVSTALAALTANHATLDPVELVLACQWAENTYPGVPCGIMDQFISVMGQQGHAMLLDCRDRSRKHVPLGSESGSNVRVVISNSNIKHELASGEYGKRRKQCEDAVAVIARKNPGITLLRDVTPAMLEQSKGDMDEVVYRRARHVITEIERTTAFAAGLEKHDYARCGQLMFGSHASLRDDYEVSAPELDVLVEIARTVKGVYGARMTGGGFGGCIVALCDASAVTPLTAAIDEQYPPRASGLKASTFATVPSQGARVDRME